MQILSSHGKCNYFHTILISDKTDDKVLLNVHIFLDAEQKLYLARAFLNLELLGNFLPTSRISSNFLHSKEFL